MPILVVDVGGTNAAFALASHTGNSVSLEKVASFASCRFETFDEALQAYLTTIGFVPQTAVLAVAGPVADGRSKLTNLPWHICADDLESAFGLRTVRLINDLEAVAWSIPHLRESDLLVLQRGEPAHEGTIAVIAPGTGLGEAFLTWNDTSYVAHPTEGGHADFAPSDEEQERLLRDWRATYGHVSVERVCSGSGLAHIYRWLVETGNDRETPSVQAELAETDDIAPIITSAAQSGTSPICDRAVRIFVDVLAAEASNLALKTLATGGVFLGGGIPKHIAQWLQADLFVDRFCAKGRFSTLLRRIPLSVIEDPHAPLRGAAVFAAARLPKRKWEDETE